MTNVRDLAMFYRKQLEQDKRNDGRAFWKFKDADKATEERCRALAFAAHGDGDMLPDDWRYTFMHEVLSAIEDADDLDEIEVEADIYTAELTDWLHSRVDRASYCDEAVSEGLVCDDAGMVERLTGGQYLEKREVLAAVLQHLRDEAEESEDGEGSEEASA